MARRKTVIRSQAFSLEGEVESKFEFALAALFDTLGQKIVTRFSLPVEVELKFKRVNWDGHIEATLSGDLLPLEGRSYGD